MNSSTVPLVDLGVAHRRIAAQVEAGFASVLERTAFVLGPEVASFESAFAAYCGVPHCIGVGNGTDALELALRSCGIGAGDEVIVPANTFVATAEAVVRAGATVVLADVTEDYLLDPTSVAERLTDRTAAVMAVHLYGQMAPMEALASVVGPGVVLIEDAAQSQGAAQNGRRAGSVGLVAGTSFYPGKNLGAYGDAGAVLTQSDAVAARLRSMRNHGGERRYEHREFGFNSRLDTLQAVVLLAKLEVLDDWNAERRAASDLYGQLLADVDGLTLPEVAEGNDHVWHLYVIRVEDRDELLADLNSAGVGAGIHYPVPVHLLPSFTHLGHNPGDFPKAEALASRILSLPIFPGITTQQQEHVAEVVRTHAAVRRS